MNLIRSDITLLICQRSIEENIAFNRGLWTKDQMLEACKAVDNVFILLLLFPKQKSHAQKDKSSKVSNSYP